MKKIFEEPVMEVEEIRIDDVIMSGIYTPPSKEEF